MLALLAIAALPTQYRIVELEPPAGAGDAVQAVDINNRGEVLVQANGGFLWRNGQYLPLGPSTYQSNMDGGSSLFPVALNNLSAVGGSMGNGTPIFMSGLTDVHAFVWKGAGAVDLGVGLGSETQSINDLGDVGGNGDHRGFVRVKGKMWEVGTLSNVPAGNLSTVKAINNHRLFLGTSTYGKRMVRGSYDLDSCPFLADGNRRPFRLRPVPIPAGTSSAYGQALNDHGVVFAVAFSRDGRGIRPYLVTKGKVNELAFPSRFQSLTNGDLNERGDVVGTGTISYEPPEKTEPCLWSKGRPVAFPTFPDWKLLTATGINDAGQICGTGVHNGKTRGYVLIPE